LPCHSVHTVQLLHGRCLQVILATLASFVQWCPYVHLCVHCRLVLQDVLSSYRFYVVCKWLCIFGVKRSLFLLTVFRNVYYYYYYYYSMSHFHLQFVLKLMNSPDMKNALRETQTLCAGCSKAESKIVAWP